MCTQNDKIHDRGCLTAVLGFITTLATLGTYVDNCSKLLPDETSLGDDIDWVMGPGFVCLLVATLIKPIDLFVHLIVPVVKPDPENDDDKKLSEASAL